MAKINLLYVITKLELGGAQTQLLSLIRHLDSAQFNIFLFTARDGILMKDALAIPGLNVHRSRFLERPINPIVDIPAFFEIVRFIKKHAIHIVHTHSSKAGILGRLAGRAAGVRLIYHTVHGWPFNAFQPRAVRMFYTILERIIASFTTAIIVVSGYDKRLGLKCAIGSPGRYVLIRYGIDRDTFAQNKTDLRLRLGIDPHTLIVGMTACFKPQKAIGDFLAVARQICAKETNVIFVIAGDGDQRPAVEKMIAASRLDGRVVLLGWRRDIASVLRSLDVFILTSLWEGLPIAVIEAMAASRPVVVTDTGGISELVKDNENGFLVPVRDTRAMTEKIIPLLRNGDMRKQFGEKAHNSITGDYTTRHMAAATSRLYEKLPRDHELA